MERQLTERLIEVGIDPSTLEDAALAWRLLHERFGARVTIIDRYALEAQVLGIHVSDLPAPTRSRLGDEVLAAQFPGIELIGEPSGHPIEIVPYDDRWPGLFESWRNQLRSALGAAAISIHHVGSTAVPGLAAKPIVDIQVGVARLDDESSYVPQIEATGVLLRSRESEHRYFRPAGDEPRVVHIHVCEAAGVWAADHLLFRDFLRNSATVRDSYAALKTDLAARYRSDRLAYTDGKATFIVSKLAEARVWASDIGWKADVQ